ncbi:MAG: helix-turn-helix domain-containing protein [Alphaproteobacteria bacterium]|nr:helix-turn-helix domain-containing protein [Alphaproteobacteria bacterium]
MERVWRSHSKSGGTFLSMAEGNIEIVFTRLPGFAAATLRGPVTHATTVECPPEGEWLAIRFRLGTYFPRIDSVSLHDHRDLNLPILPDGRFWFSGLSWEIPSFDNAEDFVARLATTGVITRDADIEDAVVGGVPRMSQRSVQRHVLRATGLTLSSVQQIERARRAAVLLKEGCSILDVTHSAGYADQAHLTRSVKHLIGMTPAKLLRDQPQLSFSFKT